MEYHFEIITRAGDTLDELFEGAPVAMYAKFRKMSRRVGAELDSVRVWDANGYRVAICEVA